MSLIVDKLTGNIYLFDIPSSGGGGTGTTTPYQEVNQYSQLPSAASNNGIIYVVRQSSGLYVLDRKEAGMYYSNGVSWTRLGDISSFFNDENFQVFDGTDNTKKIRFQLSGLTTNSLRTITMRNSDGTIAYLSDIGAKLDTSIFATYTGTTAPNQFANRSLFNGYTGTTNTAINNRLLITNFNSYTGTTQTNINNKQKIITSGTAAPSGGVDGDIYLQYV